MAVLSVAALLTGCASGAGGGGGGDDHDALMTSSVDAGPLDRALVRSSTTVEVPDGTAQPETDGTRAEATSRLGAAVVGAAPGKNVVVSPTSIMLAFAMLREGATGESASQIDSVFGLGTPTDGQDVGAATAALRARLSRDDGPLEGLVADEPPASPLLHLGDALFAAPDQELGQPFLDRIGAYHDAGVYRAGFADGSAGPLIDEWVRRETGGLIQTAPAPTDPGTRLALLSTVTFAARWKTMFWGLTDEKAAFTRGDGRTRTVAMMRAIFDTPYGGKLSYAQGHGWRAVALPYTDRYSMYVALPEEGSGTLTADQWQEVRGALATASPHSVALSMPRWGFSSTVGLADVLREVGLSAPFRPQGDLDGIFPGAVLTSATHSATITVAEKGTVAAGATELGLGGGGPPKGPDEELVLNRPFDFQIVADDDQLVLFAGHVDDPAAAG